MNCPSLAEIIIIIYISTKIKYVKNIASKLNNLN